MSENVYNAFLSIFETTALSKYEIEYKGKIFTNFIFCKVTGNEPLYSGSYGSVFKSIRTKFKRYSDAELPKSLLLAQCVIHFVPE